MSQPLPLQASAAVWKLRALRYTALYVVLVAALLGLRYTTRYTYRDLRELRVSVAELQSQRDQLELEVQTLTTGPRVLAWATAQGMVPYAQASKTTTEIQALPPVPGYPAASNSAAINSLPSTAAPTTPAPEPLTPSSATLDGASTPSTAPAEQTSGTDPPSSPDAASSSAPAPTRPRLEVTTRWK